MANRVTRRQAIARLGIAAGGAALVGARPVSAEQRPNIVMILADDLGYGDLGCYGQTEILTPNLDAMASTGMRFTQCYAGSPVSAPSRCALMTGYHAGHGRVPANYYPWLHSDDVTVAEVLRGTGYATGVVGKWHLGDMGTPGAPNQQGFDTWFGYDFGSKARDYYPALLSKNGRPVRIRANEDGRQGVYAPELMTDKALKFIADNQAGPFFLYLAYSTPHASHESWRLTGDGYPVPSDAPYTDRQWPQAERNYAAMITHMDGQIGRVLAQLDALGIADNTAVFFASDNGPASKCGHDAAFFRSAGPFEGRKGGVHEGGIRVPMVVRWPGVVPGGVDSDHMWAFWDFLPTAAEMAGASPPGDTDGASALRALRGQHQPRPDHLFWQNWDMDGEADRFQAVRFGRWKVLRHGYDAPVEVYNLRNDLAELDDRSAIRPDIAATGLALIEAAHVGARPRLEWTNELGYFGDGVAPNSGAADDTTFRYEVDYCDLDRAEPLYVRLLLRRDGVDAGTHDMQPVSGAPPLPGRTYFHEMPLPEGNHEYRFEAATVLGAADGSPTLWRVGPIMPAPPFLSWVGSSGYLADGVKPQTGRAGQTAFQFKVLYRAHDGRMPHHVRVRLWRNGLLHDQIDMQPKDGPLDPVGGIVYRASLVLPEGSYDYTFRARSRTGSATGAPTKRVRGGVVATGGAAAQIASLSAVDAPGGVRIEFSLSSSARVSVRVTNIAGRPVRSIQDGVIRSQGRGVLLWNGLAGNGRRAPAGWYNIELVARGDGGEQSRAVARLELRRR